VKKNAYTLIEIMVVVAATGLIMTTMIGVILGSFKAQNRAKSNNKITENGKWIMNELRKNVFNSRASDIECDEANGSWVQVKNLDDAVITTLSCSQDDNQIASVSAEGVGYTLNSNEVDIKSCNNFVSCESVGGKVTGVTFNFMLEAETSGVGTSQLFSTKVTVRN
jgi:type II secretory pathway pseudopilin PulG